MMDMMSGPTSGGGGGGGVAPPPVMGGGVSEDYAMEDSL